MGDAAMLLVGALEDDGQALIPDLDRSAPTGYSRPDAGSGNGV